MTEATTTTPAAPTGPAVSAQPAAGAPAPASVAVAKPAEPVQATLPGVLGDVADPDPNAPKPEAAKAEAPGEVKALEIKIPEGMEADPALLAEFGKEAAAAGLTSESASKLAGWWMKRTEAANATTLKTWSDQGATWEQELKADKDFGGAKWDATTLAAKKALRSNPYGSAVSKYLADTGQGNHPALVRFIASIGHAMAEDNSNVGTGKPAGGVESERDRLRREYPNSPELFKDGG